MSVPNDSFNSRVSFFVRLKRRLTGELSTQGTRAPRPPWPQSSKEGAGSSVKDVASDAAPSPSVWIEPVSDAAKRQTLLEKRVVEDGRLLIGRRGSIAELDDKAKKEYLIAEAEPYTVSKRQCRIEIHGSDVWLVDLGSRHGTLINDKRIGARSNYPKKVRLERGAHRMIPGPSESPFVFSIVVD